MSAEVVTATIAQGATESSVINAQQRSAISVNFPTMTGTAASVQASEDGVTYKAIGNESGALSILSPSGRLVNLGPSLTFGHKYLKIVSGSTEAEARSLSVILNDYVG